MRATLVVALALFGGTAGAADYPKPAEGDVVLKDFQFAAGEALDLKVHYRTIGRPRLDKTGKVRNAVLILHGTTGSGAQFVGAPFAGELFGAGQHLAAMDCFHGSLLDGRGHRIASATSCSSLRSSMVATSVTLAFPN
jgi:homoserine O-acetyltransferase